MKILFRHGQCAHNVENRISCSLDSKSGLTEYGKELIRQSALELKDMNLSGIKIYCSPLLRTKQTAKIICDILEIDHQNIIYDERLKEAQYGSYDEGPVSNLPHDVYDMDKFKDHGSETYEDINNRINSFLNDCSGECVIVVSHALPLRVMHRILTGIDDKLKVAKYFIVK